LQSSMSGWLLDTELLDSRVVSRGSRLHDLEVLPVEPLFVLQQLVPRHDEDLVIAQPALLLLRVGAQLPVDEAPLDLPLGWSGSFDSRSRLRR